MKILWMTWKDRKNPLAGGAEVVNEELAKRLAADGHEVVFLVGGFKDCESQEEKDGFKIIRLGNRLTVYHKARVYYKKNLQGWPDLVIDEVNTIPFFAKFCVKERNILFVHQLCREIWFYQMWFPLSLIGYILEPFYLWLLRDREVITVSNSTKNDLLRFGFKEEKIKIISEGIELEPVTDLDSIEKYEKPTLLSLGSIRPMKRTLDILRAYEFAKKNIKDLKLIIAGDTNSCYGRKFLKAVENSQFKEDITYLGVVNQAKKTEVLQKSHLIAVTSVKEGWGLIVTEANSQGIPAVVYDVDGLRDSVSGGETGVVCKENNSINLAKEIVNILENKSLYEMLRINCWKKSRNVNFKKSYSDFIKK